MNLLAYLAYLFMQNIIRCLGTLNFDFNGDGVIPFIIIKA